MTRRFTLDGRRWHIAEGLQRCGIRGPVAYFRLAPEAFAELFLYLSPLARVPVPEKECLYCGAPPADLRCFYCGELARPRVQVWVRDRLANVYADPTLESGAVAVHPWGDETELVI